MRIDDNPQMHENIRLEKEGKIPESHRVRDDFVEQVLRVRDGGEDTCSCKAKCIYHGRCFECVMIHRGHRDHLPNCLKGI